MCFTERSIVVPEIDFQTALHRIEMHEKVCTERHGNIWQALADLKAAVSNVQKAVAESNTQHHARFNTISARMWGLLVWVAGASIAGLGSVVLYLLTRGH
jgi:hypothetical protein